MLVEPLYALSGLIVGVLVGMTGVGGGSLMTPLLILLFGVNPATAVGTDLLYAAITKSGGAVVHGLNRSVNWRIVRSLAAGSIPMSLATTLVLVNIGRGQGIITGAVSSALGPALVLTAIALIFRARLIARFGGWTRRLSFRQRITCTVITGAILGVLVTLSSVGAGAIGVTAVMLLDPDTESKRLVGSDIAHAVPLTLVAGLGHLVVGTVDFQLLTSLLMGSLPGILIGSQISNRIPEAVLRPILAIILLIVGGRIMLL